MESNNEIDPHRDQQADSQNAEQAETTKTPDTPVISEIAPALTVENSGETTVGTDAGISSNETKKISEINGADVNCMDDLKNMDAEHMNKSTNWKETNEAKDNKKTVSTENPTDVVKSVSVISDDSKSSMSSATANLLHFSLSKQEKETPARETLGKETLGKETLGKETLDKETSAKEIPADEKMADEKMADEKMVDEKMVDEKNVDEEKVKETDNTSGKKTNVSNVREPSSNGKDALPNSTFLKLDRKFSLHDESTAPPASNLRSNSNGAFYLEVRGMLEIVNMDELRNQLSNEIGEGTKRTRPSVSSKTSPEDITKSRSTSVPAKAVSKHASSKDNSNKRLMRKPEDLNKSYGSNRASISSKKAQMPSLPSSIRQLPKKPQESNVQAKGKENGPGIVSTRFLGSQKTPTNEEKNVPTVTEKMKATFIPTKKETLKHLPTKPASLAKERIVGKIPPQPLIKSLPPKDLLTKIKSPLPAKAMPKQVRSLQKNPSDQKEKEAGDAKDSQKETAKHASLTPSARNSVKPKAGISARKTSVRVKTNASEALTKKENTKQISSLRSHPKRVLSNSAKMSLAKLAGTVKSKEKKKSLEKEKENLEKKNKSASPLKQLDTTEKVPEELPKEETQVEEAVTQEKKDMEEKKEEEKEPEQKQGDENQVEPDEGKQEDESEKTTNEQQETQPEAREISDKPKEDQETEKLEEQPHIQVEGKEEINPEVETEGKPEETIKEDEAKTEKNEEEAVVETEKNAENANVDTEENGKQTEGNEIISENNVEKEQITPEEEVKEVEVKTEGKIDTSRTTDRKKEERKKSDGKKSVDLKSIKKANMKSEIVLMKKVESKLKMGLKFKGLHKNGNITVPSIKSDVNGLLKEKKESKKIVGKDMEKTSMFASLTLKKGLHAKKSNDIKKVGVVKSETKDTNTEKKKSDLASEKTSMKVSIKGSMKVAVKGIAKGATKTPVKAVTKGPITAASKTATAAKTPTSAKVPSTAKTQSVTLVKESEKAPEVDKTPETEKTNEAEETDMVKEETLEAGKINEVGETLEKEKILDTEIAPEMEADAKMEPIVEPSQEMHIEEMQGKEAENDEKEALTSLRSLGSSKVTSHSLSSVNSNGKTVKPLNLKKLGSFKNKKSGGKKKNADLAKLEDQVESNARTTSENVEKENTGEMGTEKETENKLKESNISPLSKRSLKNKKSLSSKFMSGSATNNSLFKKISSVSDKKNKNSIIKKKMGSGLKGNFWKAKNATMSKGDNPLNKQKSKIIRRNTENYECMESIGKNVLRRSQTKKEFMKSGIGLGSLSSTIKTEVKLKKFKTENFNKKLMRKYMKQKGKKKTKKENTGTSDSDDECSVRMNGPALSGTDSPNRLANSLTTEKMSLGISKIGSNKALVSTAKKSTLKKQKSKKLAQLTSNHPNSFSPDAASLASPTHDAFTKSKNKNKKTKPVNLWNDTLEEEMDRIIQDNTILLDEQTDQKMRQMLLENEEKLMKCKNAVVDADTSKRMTSPNMITPSTMKSRAKSMKRISEQKNMHHLTFDGPLYDYRSASVGNVMRNASATLSKKPFTNVFSSNMERYTYEPPVRPGIKVVPAKLKEPSSKTAKWLFNNCCYKNTVQNDINITSGRNEPLLRDFSSLLNEKNKYIPVVYGSQQAFNPNVNTLNDSLKKSNIYNSNMLTKKMQYHSNNVPNTNAAEVTLPINYRNTHHSFSVKIKKFPDNVPTRSSFCNCV